MLRQIIHIVKEEYHKACLDIEIEKLHRLAAQYQDEPIEGTTEDLDEERLQLEAIRSAEGH